MDQINSNMEKVATSIFRRSRAANSVVRGRIWPNFRNHPSSYVCHPYLQIEKGSDQEQLRTSGNTVFPIISLWGFFRSSRATNSAAGGLIWPNFKLFRAFMHVIITCKYEKDRMKNSREKVTTPIF